MMTKRDYLIANAFADEFNIIRWESSGRVPFDDILEEAGVDENTRADCDCVRDDENERLIRDYIRQQNEFENDNSPEALAIKAERDFERRAAFGPGVEVVDVFTGRVYRT